VCLCVWEEKQEAVTLVFSKKGKLGSYKGQNWAELPFTEYPLVNFEFCNIYYL